MPNFLGTGRQIMLKLGKWEIFLGSEAQCFQFVPKSILSVKFPNLKNQQKIGKTAFGRVLNCSLKFESLRNFGSNSQFYCTPCMYVTEVRFIA